MMLREYATEGRSGANASGTGDYAGALGGRSEHGLRGAAAIEGATGVYDGADHAECSAAQEQGEAGAGGAGVPLPGGSESRACDGTCGEGYGDARVRGLERGVADGDGGRAADQCRGAGASGREAGGGGT